MGNISPKPVLLPFYLRPISSLHKLSTYIESTNRFLIIRQKGYLPLLRYSHCLTTAGIFYKQFTIVISDSRVVLTGKLESMRLEPQLEI